MKNVDLLDESVNVNKKIMFLAWPTIIEQLLVTLVNYVDTAMVGSLGAGATASIAVSASFMWLINGILTANAVGYSVLVGKNIGANRINEVKLIVRQAMLGFFAVGVIFTLVMLALSPFLPVWMGAEPEVRADASAYMRIVALALVFNSAVLMCSNIIRCAGDTRTPLLFNLLTNLLNIIGNFFLIYPSRSIVVLGAQYDIWGAGMGVRGAAIATMAATMISGVLFLLVLFKRESILKISVKDGFKPDKRIIRDAFRMGLPAAMERVTVSTGQMIMTLQVTNLGTVALAANHLAVTAESLSYLPGYGFAAAATTLVSQSLGARKKEHALSCAKRCMLYGFILMSCTGVLLLTLSNPLLSLFYA